QPDAGAGAARPARGARGDDPGGRVERDAVLPRRLGARGGRPPGPLPPPGRHARPQHAHRAGLRLSPRGDRPHAARALRPWGMIAMSDTQTVWMVLWKRALASRNPHDPFEI